KLVPASARLRDLLGTVYAAQANYGAAQAAFLKAIELDPLLTDAYIRLGDLYRVSGQRDQALEKLGEMLKVRADDLPALMLTGILEQQARQYPKAIDAYKKVLEIEPRFA